jgi:hypothetical protein
MNSIAMMLLRTLGNRGALADFNFGPTASFEMVADRFATDFKLRVSMDSVDMVSRYNLKER